MVYNPYDTELPDDFPQNTPRFGNPRFNTGPTRAGCMGLPASFQADVVEPFLEMANAFTADPDLNLVLARCRPTDGGEEDSFLLCLSDAERCVECDMPINIMPVAVMVHPELLRTAFDEPMDFLEVTAEP